MIDTLFNLPFSLNRHKEAALLKEREAFLRHLQQQGTSRAALRILAGELLHVIRLLKLERLRDVGLEEIRQAAAEWVEEEQSNPRARSYDHTASYFVYAAKKWLRFMGRLRANPAPRMRFSDELEDFATWMRVEQGLSPHSIRSHVWKTSKFLSWFAERHHRLSRVTLQDVDEFLVLKGGDGWSRRSVVVAVQALQAFFRHAERRGWCKPDLSQSIIGPKIYHYEGIPEGACWKDVERLLESAKGDSVASLRAHAVLSLLAIYGLRSGEVSRLLLSDFDWRTGTFLVNHSKRGGQIRYPIEGAVGEAILAYIMKGRPRTACRHLFLTLKPPYRSVCPAVLWTLTSRRIKAAGIHCHHNGPHSLRHACATHLVEQGISFKEIGDLLGHRDSASTGIYAKVDVKALRRVADFQIGGLL